MNKKIKDLAAKSGLKLYGLGKDRAKWESTVEQFTLLIVEELAGLMEQAEDDAYHCFEPSERPTEYIEWLQFWGERVRNHLK